MAKWLLIATLGLLLLVASAGLYNTRVVNPRVMDEIRNNPNGERAAIAALLTFPDGKTIPVNYLKEGDLVFLGADGPWWRKFPTTEEDVPGTRAELFIRGTQYVGYGKTELNDQTYIDDVFSRLRPKVPEWLPDWLNGKLIVIEIR